MLLYLNFISCLLNIKVLQLHSHQVDYDKQLIFVGHLANFHKVVGGSQVEIYWTDMEKVKETIRRFGRNF